jgi:hypothetical protein
MGPSADAVVDLLDFLVIVAALVWPGSQTETRPCAGAGGARYRRATTNPRR